MAMTAAHGRMAACVSFGPAFRMSATWHCDCERLSKEERVVVDEVWYSIERGKEWPLTFCGISLGKAVTIVDDFIKILNMGSWEHRCLWRIQSFPWEGVEGVEHREWMNWVDTLWLWVLTDFSPVCMKQHKGRHTLACSYRDSTYLGWLLGDCGSSVVDRRGRVSGSTVVFHCGSWVAERHRQRKMAEDKVHCSRAHWAVAFSPLPNNAILCIYPGKDPLIDQSPHDSMASQKFDPLLWGQTLRHLDILGGNQICNITLILQVMKIPCGWHGTEPSWF